MLLEVGELGRDDTEILVGKDEDVASRKGEEPEDLLGGGSVDPCPWKVTAGGITTLTVRDGLASDYVRSIHQDRHGVIWVATDGGVSRIANGQIVNTRAKNGSPDDFVRAIYEDRDGALWFGTYGNGLARLKNGTWSSVTPKDGLLDHTVSQILEDGHGDLWLSGNRGICRVPKRVLDAFCDGRIRSVSCVRFAKADGMTSAECNGGCQPAGCKTRDGRLLFPTMAGVVGDQRRAPGRRRWWWKEPRWTGSHWTSGAARGSARGPGGWSFSSRRSRSPIPWG